jgi:DNA-binding SARP family transcriptional activator
VTLSDDRGPSVLAGQWAVPLARPAAPGKLTLDGLGPSAPLRVDVLPGEVCVQRLAADLAGSGLPPLWARLAAYDLDRPALDALAAEVLGDAQTSGGWSLVVESCDDRQAEQFLHRIAAAEPSRPAPCEIVLHYTGAAAMPHATSPADPVDSALERLSRGRPALRESLLAVGRALPERELAGIIQASRDLDDLTARLAARLLQGVPSTVWPVLGLAARLGYGHSRFGSLDSALENCLDAPWWTELRGGWWLLDAVWRPGVVAACRGGGGWRADVALLGRLVGELVDDGAADAAMELCLDAGCPGLASDLLAGLGSSLVLAGQPRAVRRWLRRLPWSVRVRHRALARQARAAIRAELTQVTSALPPPARTSPPTVRRPAGPARHPPVLQARLLGSVDVLVCGNRVEHWHGRKGSLLLAYLLLHRSGRPVCRDVLATALWRDTAPAVSCNRLHVTLHGLRADLQTASPVPVVVFGEQGYAFNPELEIWLDTEKFDRDAARAERAQRNHDIEGALAACYEAIRAYRGDLLVDNPYEDWTLLPRERYRVQMLEVLGRAAQLAFDAGLYADSVEVGQRLLALDFCREDVHRLLMRAHARLGRPHLAVRQFELCSRQLRRELDMPPARETVELYGKIRARAVI